MAASLLSSCGVRQDRLLSFPGLQEAHNGLAGLSNWLGIHAPGRSRID